ncbi:MAG: acetyl-CoA hydrolase/transferase family protein [Bdellovibrionota bacterium]
MITEQKPITGIGLRLRLAAQRFFVFAVLFLFPLALFAGPLCEKYFANLPQIRKQSVQMAEALEDFAVTNELPMRVLEVGPPERRVNRLFVAIDINDKAMMTKFRNRFQLHPTGKKGPKGVLAFESSFPTPQNDHYVTIALRRDGGAMGKKIYRWGRRDETLKEWLEGYSLNPGVDRSPQDQDIVAWSNLVGLDAKEVKTVESYLAASDVDKLNPKVLPPKSTNCMNWMCGIQYGGPVKAGVPREKRQLLFNDLLQISATIDPREWVLRVAKASGENHTSMVIFVDGKKGLKRFKSRNGLDEFLPGDPKIPYAQILKGINTDFAADSQIMKAVAKIPDGGRVFFPIAAGASPEAVVALAQYAKGLKEGLNVHMLVNGVPAGSVEKALAVARLDGKPAIDIDALFVGPNLRGPVAEGKVDVKDDHLGALANKMFKREEGYTYDAIVVRVAPADAEGRYSLGANNDMILDIIEKNPGIKVIAEVNENVPRTIGKNYLQEKDIAAKFKSDTKLAGPSVPPYEEGIEGNIGRNLAGIIDDGSTLQIGIGNVFGGLPTAMAEKVGKVKKWNGIEMYSEMVGDSAMAMTEKGVVKNIKAGFGFGSEEFYRWTAGNKKIEFLPTRVMNDRALIAQNPKMTSVNTALQVDLAGNANATVGPGGRVISSVGGQFDFMRGAADSPGGKSIMVIRARVKGKAESAIVLDTYNGNVTTAGDYVSHVVTEFGVAEIKGTSPAVRAARIINVAHPDDRRRLFEEALAKKILDKKMKFEGQKIAGPGV